MDRKEEKLQSIIDAGKSTVVSTLENISKEFAIRKDFIVKSSALTFGLVGDRLGINVKHGKGDVKSYALTDHSESQLYSELQIPTRFGKKLIELDEGEYLLEGCRKMADKVKPEGLLLRTVGDTAKGILSTRYRRMDASPVFESFVGASLRAGYVPYQGYNTERRYQLTFLKPEIFQPIEKEYIVFTLSITTSDYGAGALAMEMGVLRIFCENLAIGHNLMRRVHLGSRINESDEVLTLSQATYDLDTKTMASAVNDIIGNSVEGIERLTGSIVNANLHSPTDGTWEGLQKRIGKELTVKAKTLYDTGVEELLPSSKSLWRLSNTLSLLANDVDNPDTAIDLRKEAMAILP